MKLRPSVPRAGGAALTRAPESLDVLNFAQGNEWTVFDHGRLLGWITTSVALRAEEAGELDLSEVNTIGFARCGCDAALADHQVIESRGHGMSSDTVTETSRCLACGNEWTDEYTYAELQRRRELEERIGRGDV